MGAQIDWERLSGKAWEARQQAYAPYSNFKVGAAVLAESGEVFTGCNVENTSFGLTICAERVAIVAAIVAGVRRFSGIAIVADVDQPISPCGACRQFLSEFAPGLLIFCSGRNGVHRLVSLAELLPLPFKGLGASSP